ncbi:hypothetical protein [Actinoplanes sp. CA-252034]|uniref:hypothetical protein n=1 Tax=Actinoplanes sp. CA-252034 TaxID=3239906 RepID=UPI003D960166
MDDEHLDVMPGERRSGRGVVAGGTVLLGFAALAVLIALLVVSPAAFVSLLPEWLTKDHPAGTVAWLVAGLSAGLAAVVAVRRGPVQWFRGAVITVLVTVAALCAIYALTSDSARRDPAPESTCVAYSGGRHTCPGG